MVAACKAKECDRPARTRGLCNACYEHVRKHGTLARAERRLPVDVRLDRSIDRDGPVSERRPDLGRCWLWLGAPSRKGYGMFKPGDGTGGGAHRFVYEWLVGPIPDGLQLDHLCMVKICVNPDHLEPVTNAENMARAKVARLACRRGHPFEGNEIVRADGTRTCRECSRVRIREWKRANRQKAAA